MLHSKEQKNRNRKEKKRSENFHNNLKFKFN